MPVSFLPVTLSDAHKALCRHLNYSFTDNVLLKRALTHRSKSTHNYERLEFLGDSILNFTISSYLYERYPGLSEGELTRLRAGLVKKDALAGLARSIDLGNYLEMGSGELKSGGHDRDSILADALEAIFGAVYEDGGIEAAQLVILQVYRQPLDRLTPANIEKDPKTKLQEFLQKQSIDLPIYKILEVTGEPHKQLFVVECMVPGLNEPVRGQAGTRRGAEQYAAAKALELLTSG